MLQKNIKKIILGTYIFLILSVLYHLMYAQKIIPGVSIGGVSVGGLTSDQALEKLKKNDTSISKKLVFKYNEHTYEIPEATLGFTYDYARSVSRAFEVGRTKNVFVDSKDKLVGLVKSLYLAPFYSYDKQFLNNELLRIKGDLSKSSEDARVILDGSNNPIISESVVGYRVSGDELNKSVLNAFNNFDYGDIKISVVQVKPHLESQDIKPFFSDAEKLIKKDFKVFYDSKSWNLSPKQKIDLITFVKNTDKTSMVVNKVTFDSFVDLVKQDVDVLPRGKVTADDHGNVQTFDIIQEGKEMNVDQFSKDFENALFSDETSVKVATYPISSLDKDKYGIYHLLGEGKSKFAGSSTARIHNLTLAAERTNGVLVPPGGIYSINKSIGAINAENGYYMALVISGGKTVLGEGGGVCQTSTTVFRAALNAGLPIVMRYAHDYRVHYYEEESPVGIDATIFQPSLDFQFKNDTPNYVLVQSSYDIPSYSLNFRIYGTPDGRTVEMTEPIVTGQVAPPEPLYQDDPTLKKGVVNQVDWAAWGANVSFTRTVKRDDEVISENTFVSRYRPWRAIYLVGTKE